MPYINIRITDEGVSQLQKSALIEGAAKLLQKVLNKNPATTIVVIDEANTDNWGIAWETVSKRRKESK